MNKYEKFVWLGNDSKLAKLSNYFTYKNYKSWSINRFIKRGSRVLDAGCSTGELVDYIHRRKKCEVYGIDISRKAISIARKRYPYKFSLGSVERLPYKDGYFDFIVCYDILEHLDKPIKALDEFYRVLKKGGSLLIEYETCDRYDKRAAAADRKNLSKSSWIHAGAFLKEFHKFKIEKSFWGGQLLAKTSTYKIIKKLYKIPLFMPVYASFELIVAFLFGKHIGYWYFVKARKALKD